MELVGLPCDTHESTIMVLRDGGLTEFLMVCSLDLEHPLKMRIEYQRAGTYATQRGHRIESCAKVGVCWDIPSCGLIQRVCATCVIPRPFDEDIVGKKRRQSMKGPSFKSCKPSKFSLPEI